MQERMDLARWRGVCVVQQRGNQTGYRYPKEWQNQKKWRGGWTRDASGKLHPRQGGKLKVLANLFANPNLPASTTTTKPFTFDYEHLQKARLSETPPTARPVSVITGKKMGKDRMGPELGRRPRRGVRVARPRCAVRERAERDVRDLREHLHDVSAETVRALLNRHAWRRARRARCTNGGRRHRARRPGQVPRLAHVHFSCPYKKIYFN